MTATLSAPPTSSPSAGTSLLAPAGASLEDDLQRLYELTDRHGTLPGRGTVKRELGVSEARARKLLDEAKRQSAHQLSSPAGASPLRQLVPAGEAPLHVVPTEHAPAEPDTTSTPPSSTPQPTQPTAGQDETNDTQSALATGTPTNQTTPPRAAPRRALRSIVHNAPVWTPVAATLAMAWHGQFRFALDQLALPTFAAAAAGAFAEMLMLGTNLMAHTRRKKGDRALALRAFAVLCASAACFMNYWHFADAGLAPNQRAVTYGLASLFGFSYWEITASAQVRAAQIDAGFRPPPRPIVTTAPGPRLSVPRMIARALFHPIWTVRALDAGLRNPRLSPLEAWDAATPHRTTTKRSRKKQSRKE